MKILLIIILLAIITTTASATNEITVHEACEFQHPATATLYTSSGLTIHPDPDIPYTWTGITRPANSGEYRATLELIDAQGQYTQITISYIAGKSRPWSLTCTNGIKMRIQSDYLDQTLLEN